MMENKVVAQIDSDSESESNLSRVIPNTSSSSPSSSSITNWDRTKEGYPVEYVINIEGVDDGFKCLLCSSLAYDPVITSCCQTIFCSCCLTQWLNKGGGCPQRCQDEIDPKPLSSNKATNRILGRIKIKCANNCGWSGDYADLNYHLQTNCPEEIVLCTFCNLQIKRDIFNQNHSNRQCIPPPPSAPSISSFQSNNDIVTLGLLLKRKDEEIRALNLSLNDATSEIDFLRKCIELKSQENDKAKEIISELLEKSERLSLQLEYFQQQQQQQQQQPKQQQKQPQSIFSHFPQFSQNSQNSQNSQSTNTIKCSVCQQVYQSSQNHICVVLHHPGVYQRIRWKGFESGSWTCCKSTNSSAQGCKVLNIGREDH